MHRVFVPSLLVVLSMGAAQAAPAPLRLPAREYRDRMVGGWIGQMAGVAWGAPTEFKFRDRIIPEAQMPRWRPELINGAFGQDDLYVDMTFLRTLEVHGLDVPIRQAGIDFANTRYSLWCANRAGRTNLRRGIAPPDSSHPRFSKCPNDIDYQIEADFSGLIAPGMPQLPVELGEKFGRLMNYGDGMYAGQFIGGMYAAAFFESDRVKVVEAGLRCIPAGCQYAEMVRDVLRWYRDDPKDWERAWALCQRKYREDPQYQKASNGGIDCKINGAYVLLGLLYGDGDPDATITIACRAGQDSDCNPSSAAGVLFTQMGASRVPERFTSALDKEKVFSHTPYSFPALVAVCEKLARAAVLRAGGRVEKGPDGEDVFIIPVRDPKPSALELSWAPGPIADSCFTEAEMAQITETANAEIQRAVERVAPGWRIADCGDDMNPGVRPEFRGRKNVLVTHPLDQQTACALRRAVDVPAGKRASLRLVVSHHNQPEGDWVLVVRADGKELLKQTIGRETVTDGWATLTVDLTPFAGRRVNLELLNQANGWSWEAGYWGEIALE